MATPPRRAVETALEKYFELGARAAGHPHADWNRWVDLFTEDALYVEVQYGTFHGREEIRKWIVKTMATVPDMYFPPIKWQLIDGDRVAFCIDNALPNPDPKGEPIAFPTVSLLQYRDGLWCYEEDIYDVRLSERAKQQFAAARAGKGK